MESMAIGNWHLHLFAYIYCIDLSELLLEVIKVREEMLSPESILICQGQCYCRGEPLRRNTGMEMVGGTQLLQCLC